MNVIEEDHLQRFQVYVKPFIPLTGLRQPLMRRIERPRTQSPGSLNQFLFYIIPLSSTGYLFIELRLPDKSLTSYKVEPYVLNLFIRWLPHHLSASACYHWKWSRQLVIHSLIFIWWIHTHRSAQYWKKEPSQTCHRDPSSLDIRYAASFEYWRRVTLISVFK